MREMIEEIELIVSPDVISKYVNQPPINHLDSVLLNMQFEQRVGSQIKVFK